MEKTIGEKRVRTDFNISGDSKIDEIKAKSAELINLIESARGEAIDQVQLQVIKDHLDVFFKKITPDRHCENCENENCTKRCQEEQDLDLDLKDLRPNIWPSPNQCTCNSNFNTICPVHGWQLMHNQIIC